MRGQSQAQPKRLQALWASNEMQTMLLNSRSAVKVVLFGKPAAGRPLWTALVERVSEQLAAALQQLRARQAAAGPFRFRAVVRAC